MVVMAYVLEMVSIEVVILIDNGDEYDVRC